MACSDVVYATKIYIRGLFELSILAPALCGSLSPPIGLRARGFGLPEGSFPWLANAAFMVLAFISRRREAS